MAAGHILAMCSPPNSCIVMLHILKEDNPTGSFSLYCLLHVLIMIIKSGVICTSVHLYTIIIYRDGMAVYMYSDCSMQICGYFKVINKYCIIFHIS